MNATYGTCALQMPSSYVLMDTEEMEYLDGGLYFSNSQIKGIVTAIGLSAANPGSVAAVTAAVKYSAAWLVVKFGALGLKGVIVGAALGGWIASQAKTIGERFFSALMKRKGVDFGISWKWGVIPNIKGTLR